MESGDITRNSRALVTVMAVLALLIALYSVIDQLTGPEEYGPGDTEIVVSAGDRFTIDVPDDPGDGRHWIVAAPRPDPAVLRTTGWESPGALGAPENAAPAAGGRLTPPRHPRTGLRGRPPGPYRPAAAALPAVRDGGGGRAGRRRPQFPDHGRLTGGRGPLRGRDMAMTWPRHGRFRARWCGMDRPYTAVQPAWLA
ncbi:hypothetical protein O1L44_20720 [Streptomyces noursei]|nr:hypothetical protein [Streptomyces noursei]